MGFRFFNVVPASWSDNLQAGHKVYNDRMALAAGARIGPYEIRAPLGAGGMGEAYRATGIWILDGFQPPPTLWQRLWRN
jgi:hypothetical protein